MAPARILLADDNPAILANVARMLAPQYEIVGTLSDGESVLREYDRLRPDLVVLDISMGEIDGIEVASRLRDTGRHAKIIFLTVHDDQDFVSAAVGAGGSGYVVKSRMSTDLLTAVSAVLSGELFVSAAPRE